MVVAASTALLFTLLPAVADVAVPGEVYGPMPEQKFAIGVAAGGAHAFRRSLDDGGSVTVTRAAIETTLRLHLAEPVMVTFSAGYRYDLYDFDGAPFPAVGSTREPWDDTHAVSFAGLVSYKLDETWTLSGGGFAQFSAERDASWSDAFSGGGLVSVTYALGDRGIIGAGVGMTTAIEDDAKFFPVVVLDLALSEQLRVSTLRMPNPVFRNGIELVYEASDSCELAFGARYDRRRFRLNDEGPVPDGIGEEKELPLWLRASWTLAPSARLDLMGGVIVWREFGIADDSGLRLDTDRGEPAAFVAAALRVEF